MVFFIYLSSRLSTLLALKWCHIKVSPFSFIPKSCLPHSAATDLAEFLIHFLSIFSLSKQDGGAAVKFMSLGSHCFLAPQQQGARSMEQGAPSTEQGAPSRVTQDGQDQTLQRQFSSELSLRICWSPGPGQDKVMTKNIPEHGRLLWKLANVHLWKKSTLWGVTRAKSILMCWSFQSENCL